MSDKSNTMSNMYRPMVWLRLIVNSYSRAMIKTLFPLTLFVGVFTLILCFVIIDVFHFHLEDTKAFHSILGVILGLFLVMRTNTAYDRWWEGRKLWGKLVNDTRQLSVKISSYLPLSNEDDREFFNKMIPNICFAMKHHLRDLTIIDGMIFQNEVQKERVFKSKHRPNIINLMMSERIVRLYKKSVLTKEEFFVLDKELKSYADIIGGCERIKSTPIPLSFSMFIKKFLFIYSISLPMAFIGEFGYWSILLVCITLYFLMSVELMSAEIEDPFGDDENDLPVDALCNKIRANVDEIFVQSAEYKVTTS